MLLRQIQLKRMRHLRQRLNTFAKDELNNRMQIGDPSQANQCVRIGCLLQHTQNDF